MHPVGQRDEIAAGKRQQRHGRPEFLKRQTRALKQKINVIHTFPIPLFHLIIAAAVYA
jgi:hypothetical protein